MRLRVVTGKVSEVGQALLKDAQLLSRLKREGFRDTWNVISYMCEAGSCEESCQTVHAGLVFTPAHASVRTDEEIDCVPERIVSCTSIRGYGSVEQTRRSRCESAFPESQAVAPLRPCLPCPTFTSVVACGVGDIIDHSSLSFRTSLPLPAPSRDSTPPEYLGH